MTTHGRRIGTVTINRAVEMIMRFEATAFFPETAPEDWAPHRSWLEPDALDPQTGEILLPAQSYLLRTAHHTILIDACIGNHKDRPNRPSWHQKTDATYLQALAKLGVSPAEIDFVMCTHMHGDHVGWNTRLENGRWVPTFPNARYVFTRKELEAWEASPDRLRRQVVEDSVLPVIAAGQAELVSNDFALDDQVWLESTPGHTPDHVAICLASQGERAVFAGDLMHSPIQCLYPEWTVSPDSDAALAKRTRRGFLERHAGSGTLVCTAHFPLPSIGRIEVAGDAFRFVAEDADW